jgi:diguanylate cyclase (GGDEF)-like protein/PAS domain S-box-containing protein
MNSIAFAVILVLAVGGAAWIILRGRAKQKALESRDRAGPRGQSEAQFYALVELSPDAILIHVDGRIVYANPAAVALLRARGAGDLIGLEATSIVHPDLLPLVRERIARQQRGERVPRVEQRYQRFDGTAVDVEVTSAPLTYQGRTAIQVFARDISERKSSERRIQRLTNLYSALGSTGELVARAHTRSELFEGACRIAVEYGRLLTTWIGLANEHTRRVELAAASGPAAEYAAGVLISLDPEAPEGRGPIGNAVREGRTSVCNDFRSDPMMAPWWVAAARHGLRSVAAFPLREGGRVVGAITHYAGETQYFTPDLIDLLERMAANLSHALDALAADKRRSRAEAALAHSERTLSTLMSNLPGMVYRCRNDSEWTMEFASDGCFGLTGYRADEIVGNRVISYNRITAEEDRGRVFAQIRSALARRARFACEYRIVHRSGALRWVAETGAGVFLPDGSLEAVEGFIMDITERKRAEEDLARFRAAMEIAADAIFLVDFDTLRYVDVTETTCQLLGYSRDELLRLGPPEINVGFDEAELRERFRQVRARGAQRSEIDPVTRYLRARDGRVIPVEVYRHYLRAGTSELIVAGARDISERLRAEEMLKHQANHDALTGLPNRNLLGDRIAQGIAHAQRGRCVLATVFLDLDNFKLVNDTLGHRAGDQLLRTIGDRLRQCVREGDTVARLGGDEFVVLLNDQPSKESVTHAVHRIVAAIGAPLTVDGHEIISSCSVGISLYPSDGVDGETLLKHADTAMYDAKADGRGVFRFFSAQMNADLSERMNIEAGLRRALERNEFVLHYQPRIGLRSGAVESVEALLRWVSPGSSGLIPPGRFIPVAEDSGLIVPIGQWVLSEACNQLRAWHQRGARRIAVSVNVSPRQFKRPELVETIQRALAQSGLEARFLEIEVTESLVMENAEDFVARLHALKALGVEVSVDDFGTGYSSLNYLKRFPVDRLKVDQTFVRDITADRDDATIVKAIVRLGHSLGLKVTAEGVETAEQLDFLRACRCDQAQGFYFSRALPAEEIETLILGAGALTRRSRAK